ncbi:MAG: hypothetical protein ACREO0_03965 [Pseudoxanthomonas sp.]
MKKAVPIRPPRRWVPGRCAAIFALLFYFNRLEYGFHFHRMHMRQQSGLADSGMTRQYMAVGAVPAVLRPEGEGRSLENAFKTRTPRGFRLRHGVAVIRRGKGAQSKYALETRIYSGPFL